MRRALAKLGSIAAILLFPNFLVKEWENRVKEPVFTPANETASNCVMISICCRDIDPTPENYAIEKLRILA